MRYTQRIHDCWSPTPLSMKTFIKGSVRRRPRQLSVRATQQEIRATRLNECIEEQLVTSAITAGFKVIPFVPLEGQLR